MVIVMQEYLLRVAVKEAMHQSGTKRPGEEVPVDKPTRIKEIIDRKSYMVQSSIGKKELKLITLPIGSPSWWHRYLVLQPDCSVHDSFDDNYVMMLHSVLRTPSTEEGDPLVTLIHHLMTASSREVARNIIVIDTSGSSTLAALWEIHRREECTRGNSRGDIFLSPSFFPTKGLSVSTLLSMMREKYAIPSSIMMENALLCLPLVLQVGLPPLLMLQYTYKNDPMAILMEAVLRTTSPILRCVSTEEGTEYAFDVSQLMIIFERLASVEKDQIRDIDAKCREQSSELVFRDFAGAKTVGWDQFRKYYYHSAFALASDAAVSIETEMRCRIIAYLSGLLQLSYVYRGKMATSTVLLDIRMDDSPLATDVLAFLRRISEKRRFICLPTRREWRCGESVQSRRTLSRLKPLFINSLST